MRSNDNVLEISALTKTFGERVVVNDVSFEVKRGEIFGFLGPNGSGKTTTIRMALGIIRQDSGRVRIFGEQPDRELLKLARQREWDVAWFEERLPGRVELPGSLQAQGLGDEVTVDTEWTASIQERSSPAMAWWMVGIEEARRSWSAE